MTVYERRNYQVAVIFSVVFHLSLVLIAFPLQLFSVPAGGVEEIAVGLYEIQTESASSVVKEPEIIVKPDQVKPEIKPEQPKPDNPAIHAPKETSNDTRNPAENGKYPKTPQNLGTGSGMVASFGQEPSYPKNAMNEGIEGEVMVRALIRTDGTLEDVIPLKPSGDSRLYKAVINSIRQEWLFKPNAENYYIDISFLFNIKTGDCAYKLINSATRP